MAQLDANTISALRSVLDEVCSHLPPDSNNLRTLVASKILECARAGEQTYDDLRQAALEALRSLRRAK